MSRSCPLLDGADMRRKIEMTLAAHCKAAAMLEVSKKLLRDFLCESLDESVQFPNTGHIGDFISVNDRAINYMHSALHKVESAGSRLDDIICNQSHYGMHKEIRPTHVYYSGRCIDSFDADIAELIDEIAKAIEEYARVKEDS